MPDPTEDEWVHRHEQLGAPDDPQALERARELVATGWELLGVHFGEGTWVFRRRRLDAGDDHSS